jgi:hypothetical protein
MLVERRTDAARDGRALFLRARAHYDGGQPRGRLMNVTLTLGSRIAGARPSRSCARAPADPIWTLTTSGPTGTAF